MIAIIPRHRWHKMRNKRLILYVVQLSFYIWWLIEKFYFTIPVDSEVNMRVQCELKLLFIAQLVIIYIYWRIPWAGNYTISLECYIDRWFRYSANSCPGQYSVISIPFPPHTDNYNCNAHHHHTHRINNFERQIIPDIQ